MHTKSVLTGQMEYTKHEDLFCFRPEKGVQRPEVGKCMDRHTIHSKYLQIRQAYCHGYGKIHGVLTELNVLCQESDWQDLGSWMMTKPT